jgi:hypothetical protein
MEGVNRVPTLRSLAINNIIFQLISAKKLKSKFNRSLSVQERRCQCCMLSKYKKFIKFARKSARKLPLPKKVIREIVSCVKFMCRDIVYFLDEINYFLKGGVLQMGDDFHWDMNGKINVQKTLEKYVFDNDRVSVLNRFLLACLSCCESTIIRFWEECGQDLVEEIMENCVTSLTRNERLIVQYWCNVLSKRERKYTNLSLKIIELTMNNHSGSNLDYFVKLFPNAKSELINTFLNSPTEYYLGNEYSVISIHEYILTNADHSAITTMLKKHKNGEDLLNCIMDRYRLHYLFAPIFNLVVATDSIEEDRLDVLRDRIRSRSHFDYWYDLTCGPHKWRKKPQ